MSDVGASETQIQRYIRLTHLISELLSMVDDNKIAFNPAVEISYLEPYEQCVLLDAMEINDCTPSHAQSIRLKKMSQEGFLNDQAIYNIMAEEKPNQQEQIKFKKDELKKYFPHSYTDEQMRKAESALAKIRSEYEPPVEVGELTSDMLFADYLLPWLEIVKVRVKKMIFSLCFWTLQSFSIYLKQ